MMLIKLQNNKTKKFYPGRYFPEKKKKIICLEAFKIYFVLLIPGGPSEVAWWNQGMLLATAKHHIKFATNLVGL